MKYIIGKICEYFFILLLIMVCMSGKPLSPFFSLVPDYDSGVFISCSKFWLDGLLLYKDIFDHKGPIVYLYDMLGLTIAGNHGIWILSVLVNLFSYVVYLKMVNILNIKYLFSRLIALCVVFIQIILVYENSAELISIPFLLVSIYYSWSSLVQNKILSNGKLFLSFVCIYIIFLIKPNFAAAAIFLLLLLFLRDLKLLSWNAFQKYFLVAVSGVIVVFMPLYLYFNYTGQWEGFVDCYWNFNLIYSRYLSWQDKLSGFFSFFYKNAINLSILIVLMVLLSKYYLNKNYKNLIFVFSGFFFVAFMNLGLSGFYFPHYLLPVVPAFLIVFLLFLKEFREQKWFLSVLSLFVVFGIIREGRIFYYESKYYVKTNSMSNQNQLINLVEKYSSPSDIVCHYRVNTSFYILCNRKPMGRFIFQSPIFRINEDFRKEYLADIKNKRPKLFVVRKCYKNELPDSAFVNYVEIDSPTEDLIVYILKNNISL